MYLVEGLQRRVDVVFLTVLRVQDGHRVLAALDVQDLGADGSFGWSDDATEGKGGCGQTH